jgi:hypothetical protein
MLTGAVERLFVDTNVLVYANVAEAPFHAEASAAIRTYEAQGVPLWISRQILRAYLATLTRPAPPAHPQRGGFHPLHRMHHDYPARPLSGEKKPGPVLPAEWEGRIACHGCGRCISRKEKTRWQTWRCGNARPDNHIAGSSGRVYSSIWDTFSTGHASAKGARHETIWGDRFPRKQ